MTKEKSQKKKLVQIKPDQQALLRKLPGVDYLLTRVTEDAFLKNIQKKVYLYTILPAFFKKYGFKETLPLPSLPSRENLGCPECLPEKCVCMVKSPHAS